MMQLIFSFKLIPLFFFFLVVFEESKIFICFGRMKKTFQSVARKNFNLQKNISGFGDLPNRALQKRVKHRVLRIYIIGTSLANLFGDRRQRFQKEEKVMERTYSQNVARAFEIADYILLIPAIFGAILATVIPSGLTLLVYGFFMVGVVLLVGYYKHSRGKLDEFYFPALWIMTAVYNFVLLLPCLYYVAVMYQSISFEMLLRGDAVIAFLIGLLIVSGYFTVIILSLKAHSFEKRKSLSPLKSASSIP